MPADSDDAALLELARAGDCPAVARLYERHRRPALRLAELLAGPDGAEDLLADAFARIVARLQAGGGPTVDFRSYLFATIRNRHRDLQRRVRREEPASDQPWLLDGVLLPADDLSEVLDDDQAAAALAALPPSWQQVLWLLEVDELPVPAVAERLGLTPAAVSSLAYRAREGLRTAYLDQRVHATAASTSECGWVQDRLSRHVRDALSARAACRIETHLATCAGCAAMRSDLALVSRRFGILPPPHRAPAPAPPAPPGAVPAAAVPAASLAAGALPGDGLARGLSPVGPRAPVAGTAR